VTTTAPAGEARARPALDDPGMASLLGIVRDEHALAASLAAALLPGAAVMWDMSRDRARLVARRRDRRERRPQA
jgi:hypothetical protein